MKTKASKPQPSKEVSSSFTGTKVKKRTTKELKEKVLDELKEKTKEMRRIQSQNLPEKPEPATEVQMARELFSAATETLKMAKHIRKLESKINKLEKKMKRDSSSESDSDDKEDLTTDSSDIEEGSPKKKKRKKKHKVTKSSPSTKSDLPKGSAVSKGNAAESAVTDLSMSNEKKDGDGSDDMLLKYACQYCGHIGHQPKQEVLNHIVNCAFKHKGTLHNTVAKLKDKLSQDKPILEQRMASTADELNIPFPDDTADMSSLCTKEKLVKTPPSTGKTNLKNINTPKMNNKLNQDSKITPSGVKTTIDYTCPDCGLIVAKASKITHSKMCRKIPTCFYCQGNFKTLGELLDHKPECKSKNWKEHPVRMLQHNIDVTHAAEGVSEKTPAKRGIKSNPAKRGRKPKSQAKAITPDQTDNRPMSLANVFFVCLKCDKQFTSGHRLRVHKQTPGECEEWIQQKTRRVGIKSSTRFCYTCKNMFPTQSDYVIHRMECTDDRPKEISYSCFICYRSYNSQAELNLHKRLNHLINEGDSNCWACGEIFPSFKELLEHVKTHKNVQSTIRSRSRAGHIRDNHHLVLKRDSITAAEAESTNIPPDVMEMLDQIDFEKFYKNEEDLDSKDEKVNIPGVKKNLNSPKIETITSSPSFKAEVTRSKEDKVTYNIAVDTRGAMPMRRTAITTENKNMTGKTNQINDKSGPAKASANSASPATSTVKSTECKSAVLSGSNLQEQMSNLLKQSISSNQPIKISSNDSNLQMMLQSLQQNDVLTVDGKKIKCVVQGMWMDNKLDPKKNIQVKSSKFGNIQVSKSPKTSGLNGNNDNESDKKTEANTKTSGKSDSASNKASNNDRTDEGETTMEKHKRKVKVKKPTPGENTVDVWDDASKDFIDDEITDNTSGKNEKNNKSRINDGTNKRDQQNWTGSEISMKKKANTKQVVCSFFTEKDSPKVLDRLGRLGEVQRLQSAEESSDEDVAMVDIEGVI